MLTGDLSDFSLPEILQFLTSTARPGVLLMRSEASTAGIVLRDGGVCLALLDLDGVRGLAARMVRSGAVDLDQLEGVTGRSDGGAIAMAIELAVTASDTTGAADVCLEHTYETLGWLTRLEQAVFSFEQSGPLDRWPFVAADLDNILAEVADRAERWSLLPEAVGDLTLVCSPLPDGADSDVILTADQWRTIALLDGRRTVGDLVELSGMGHLETCTHLHELVEDGLIELVAPGQLPTLTALLDRLGAEQVGTDLTLPFRGGMRPMPAIPDVMLVAPDAPDDETADGRVSGGDDVFDEPDTDADGDVTDAADDADADDADDADGDVTDAADADGDDAADDAADSDVDGGANQALLSRLLGRKVSAT